MTSRSTHIQTKTSPDAALDILTEAWAYYTPMPQLVTERNSAPSPVVDEYYAA
ncbi:MAG TPA: hypothetical protein VJ928_08320 [Marivita sp.]|nr:hypothetical protein [Marivita sp.]